MNYKIISQNKTIISKAQEAFASLGFVKSIHIQKVDFELVDVKELGKNALLSYKNRVKFINTLFVVNGDEDVRFCLENGFLHYIHADFSTKELILWGRSFFKKYSHKILHVHHDTTLDFAKSLIIQKDKLIKLTKQEMYLLKILSHGDFVSTQNLQNSLKLNSLTSVRTIINRIRKKLEADIFIIQKGFGYRLDIKTDKTTDEALKPYIKELQEQNQLMQNIVDKSPIFIATFVHKKLFCINESFREFLGRKLVKSLWEDGDGDFWQLFSSVEKNIFDVGEHKAKFADFVNKKTYKIQTYYFPTQDKHLLFFIKSNSMRKNNN